MTIRPFFRWYDFWIGAYVDAARHRLYICPLPMIGLRIDLDCRFVFKGGIACPRGRTDCSRAVYECSRGCGAFRYGSECSDCGRPGPGDGALVAAGMLEENEDA